MLHIGEVQVDVTQKLGQITKMRPNPIIYKHVNTTSELCHQ